MIECAFSDKELVLLWEELQRVGRVAEAMGVSHSAVHRRLRELLKLGVRIRRTDVLQWAPAPCRHTERPPWVSRLNAVIDQLRRGEVEA